MALILITDATVEPVTLAQAKVQCRVDEDITTEDDLLETLIAAARTQAEQELSRALITQTWERVIDAFPECEIELGMPTALAITSVTYIDAAGDSQVMDAADYSLDAETGRGFLLPAEGTVWPNTLDTANAVRVRFTAGYGAAASAVPASIKSWILLRVGTLYQHRSEIAAGISVTALPGGFADRLLDRYRVWGV